MPVDQSYREIQVSPSFVAIVDEVDYPLLASRKWQARTNIRSFNVYAKTSKSKANLYMHRLILGLEPGDTRRVDHINGNTLDNRRCNLRIVTHSQNMWNGKIPKNNTSGYKGVSLVAADGFWSTRIQTHKKYVVHRFKHLPDAAQAMFLLRFLLHGEFARYK